MQDQHRSILGRARQEHTAGVEDIGYPSHEYRTDSDAFSWFCMHKIINAKKKFACLRADLFLQTPILFPAERYIRQRCSFGGGRANRVIHHKKKESHLGILGLLRLFLHAFYVCCSCSSWMCSVYSILHEKVHSSFCLMCLPPQQSSQ